MAREGLVTESEGVLVAYPSMEKNKGGPEPLFLYKIVVPLIETDRQSSFIPEIVSIITCRACNSGVIHDSHR
jgi:hypothetical protein